jgi:hypothetical protein
VNINKLILHSSFFYLCLLFGCSLKENAQHIKNKNVSWKEIKGGLYLSPEGEIGFASAQRFANIRREKLKGETCANVFITTMNWDDTTKISSVVDTATFEHLGSDYYRDKNHIYNFYSMCEGGYFKIFSSDTSDFRLLSSCYARHKDEIFHHRNGGPLKVDVASFRVSQTYECIARDKHSFYEYGDPVTEEELKESMGEEAFEKIKNL